MPYIRLQNG